MSGVTFPGDEDRTVILGKTGEGKTFFAIGVLLSRANFDEMPWTIIDYKGDKLLRKIIAQNKRFIKFISPYDKPPTRPGLYYMRTSPRDEEAVDKWLWKVWENERHGLYIDEGYLLPQHKKSAFSSILTQGRSKKIPVIILYQRPVNMNLYTVSQADFYAVFFQNIETDLKKTAEYVPPAITPQGQKVTVSHRLPKYWCLWYDVSKGETAVLSSGPSEKSILETFRARLGSRSSRTILK